MSDRPYSGLREAIEKVESLVKAAKPLDVITPFPDRPFHKFFVNQGGTATLIEEPPARHAEQLKTPQELADFIAFVLPAAVASAHVLDEGTSETGPILDADLGAVMVDEGEVVYAYAFGDRKERVRVPLKKSKQYEWIKSHDDQGVDQVTLEKALRITFKGSGAEELHAAVKNLRFTTNTDAEGTIGSQGNSFSRSVNNRVSGVDQLPENVTFRFSLFDNFPWPVDIDCSVSVDVADEEIILTCYPASLLNAETETFNAIKKLYKVPAFAGKF